MPDVRLVTCAMLPAPDPDMPILVAALSARELAVEVDDWRDDRVDWADCTVTVLRSPWDYVERLDEFLAWAIASQPVTALWNPLALVRWNTHKSYLLELSSRGRAGRSRPCCSREGARPHSTASRTCADGTRSS